MRVGNGLSAPGCRPCHLLLFITGSVVFYLTPSRYQSTVVFEYLGKRTPLEAVFAGGQGRMVRVRGGTRTRSHPCEWLDRILSESTLGFDIAARLETLGTCMRQQEN